MMVQSISMLLFHAPGRVLNIDEDREDESERLCFIVFYTSWRRPHSIAESLGSLRMWGRRSWLPRRRLQLVRNHKNVEGLSPDS